MSIEAERPAPGDGGGGAQTIVDCSKQGPCVATANDGDVSQLTFRAGAEFRKNVAISPVATGAGECAGTDCVTAYNVQFDRRHGRCRGRDHRGHVARRIRRRPAMPSCSSMAWR